MNTFIRQKAEEYYTTQQIRMFTNKQRHVLRNIVLLCHWLQNNCKLGHGRRLRCAFASPNPSAVAANSCTHRRRDATKQFRLVGVGFMYWALIGQITL